MKAVARHFKKKGKCICWLLSLLSHFLKSRGVGFGFFYCVVYGVGGAIGEVLVLLKQLNIVQIFLMSIYIICV